MRNWFLTCCVLLVFTELRAQNSNNNLTVTANAALNFILTSPSDLESDQTIPGAITLTVESKSSNCTIYAKLSGYSYPPGYLPTSSILSIDWVSDNSNKDYNLVTGPVLLETFDKLLFMQKKMNGNKIYDYNYDLVLEAPGYSMVPGSYGFSITFTMTQP